MTEGIIPEFSHVGLSSKLAVGVVFFGRNVGVGI